MKINISKKVKIILASVFALILVVVLSLLLFLYPLFQAFIAPIEVTRNPAKYEKIISKLMRQEKIKFLPKKIPAEASEVQFYSYSDPIEGERVLLKFKINKDYIQKELNTHEFLNADTPIGAKQDIYFIPNEHAKISVEGFTWYVIKDKENEDYYKKYFPYFTSIGIDKNFEYIIYYYMLPNDYNYESAREYYKL